MHQQRVLGFELRQIDDAFGVARAGGGPAGQRPDAGGASSGSLPRYRGTPNAVLMANSPRPMPRPRPNGPLPAPAEKVRLSSGARSRAWGSLSGKLNSAGAADIRRPAATVQRHGPAPVAVLRLGRRRDDAARRNPSSSWRRPQMWCTPPTYLAEITNSTSATPPLRRRSQRAYAYRLGTGRNFIRAGSRGNLCKGLLAGEGLQLAPAPLTLPPGVGVELAQVEMPVLLQKDADISKPGRNHRRTSAEAAAPSSCSRLYPLAPEYSS